jgi:hypothetical protein
MMPTPKPPVFLKGLLGWKSDVPLRKLRLVAVEAHQT